MTNREREAWHSAISRLVDAVFYDKRKSKYHLQVVTTNHQGEVTVQVTIFITESSENVFAFIYEWEEDAVAKLSKIISWVNDKKRSYSTSRLKRLDMSGGFS